MRKNRIYKYFGSVVFLKKLLKIFNCFQDVITLTVDEASELLAPDLVTRAFVEVSQQTMEKIDRTRGYAGRVFSSLLHK